MDPACDQEERSLFRFFLISLLLHLLLIIGLARFTPLGRGIPPASAQPRSEVVWLDLTKKTPNQLLDGQVVDLADERSAETVPADSKYLSDRNRRVDKETQAFHTSPTPLPVPGAQQEKAAAGKAPGGGAGRESLVRRAAEEGLQKDDKPSPGAGGAQLNLSQDWLARYGASPTNYLPGIVYGEETLLNTREYIHASFFIRMKRQMEQHWNPLPILRQYNLSGKEKVETAVTIVLNPDGTLFQVSLLDTSGISALDQEALRAVRQAAPYLNIPPPLLGPDGKLTISPWRFIITSFYTL